MIYENRGARFRHMLETVDTSLRACRHEELAFLFDDSKEGDSFGRAHQFSLTGAEVLNMSPSC